MIYICMCINIYIYYKTNKQRVYDINNKEQWKKIFYLINYTVLILNKKVFEGSYSNRCS